MNNDAFITLLTALVTAYFGYKAANYANSNEYKTNLYKRQMYDVFLPMFKMIEATMYQDLPIGEVKSISSSLKNIACSHMELINPYLYKRISEFDDEISKGIFKYSKYSDLCYSIDKEYEHLKRILKFPKRGIFFKYTYKQMPTDKWKEFDTYFNTVINFLLKLALFIAIALIAYGIYGVVQSILGFFKVQLTLKL